jgi:hypothetical protein
VSRPEKSRIPRRALLVGWITLPSLLLWLPGCDSQTVQLKGGSSAPDLTGKESPRMKTAEKAEEEIFQKTKKLR